MRALELVRDRTSQEPTVEETKAIVQYCYERGVMIICCVSPLRDGAGAADSSAGESRASSE